MCAARKLGNLHAPATPARHGCPAYGLQEDAELRAGGDGHVDSFVVTEIQDRDEVLPSFMNGVDERDHAGVRGGLDGEVVQRVVDTFAISSVLVW